MSGARQFRFGFIGTGAMAATMMECFAHSQRATVVAVASTDLQRARAFAAAFGVAHAHGDVASMLARDDLDAVYIANGTSDHASTSIAALAAGKAVLCEKPFALNAAQGQQVAAAAAAHRLLFMEAQWTPFLPAFQALQRLAQPDDLGAPLHLASDIGYVFDEAGFPRLFRGPGAGVLLDLGVYPITLALHLLGPVEAVRSQLHYNAAGVDVRAALLLTHRGGGCSQLAASVVSSMPNSSMLSCRGGHVQLASPVVGAESLRVVRAAPLAPGAAPADGGSVKSRVVSSLRQSVWLRRVRESRSRGSRVQHSYGPNRYLPQLTHFISLLDAGSLASPLMPVEASLDVLKVIALARLGSPFTGRTPAS